jgi:tRNA(Met) cytidine acetyltransferase
MQQRQCVVLSGDRAWCEQATETLLSAFNYERLLCLSDQPIGHFPTLKIKQAKHQLGHDFDAVVFDGLDTLLPDNIGQSVGTLCAGGVFILWFVADNDRLYPQRFERVISQFGSQFHCVKQDDALPHLNLLDQASEVPISRTADQTEAIKLIVKVVTGHRRRPLVLSADRGRGKSAALGMAAAELLMTGREEIIVTAPNMMAVDSVFSHAASVLGCAKPANGLINHEGATLRFIAPDALLTSDATADLLLVDEAAAIPSAMLARLLQRFSRLVFATTLHGYEGTGRGFAVRFQALLDQRAPGWRHYELSEPVRWCHDDVLEAFSFEALLLDAEPVEDNLIAEADVDQCVIELIDKRAFVEDELLLRQLFGLMVLAHYRTKPSDLQLLLDNDDIHCYVTHYQGHIVACAWVVEEGLLPPELSRTIYLGQRRLKGHLLPQSLLAHVGCESAGSLRYRRILRIAVHPVMQRQGLAKALLDMVYADAKLEKVDVLGTSFSADLEVMSFWRACGFDTVRLGTQLDEVSGQRAVTLLRTCSAVGDALYVDVKKRFEQQWPDLLMMQFNQVDVELVLAISAQFGTREVTLSDWDRQDVLRFVNGAATFESCQPAIRNLVGMVLGQYCFSQLPESAQRVLAMRVMQLKSTSDVARVLGFNGKSDLITAMREAMRTLLVAFSAEDNIVIATK